MFANESANGRSASYSPSAVATSPSPRREEREVVERRRDEHVPAQREEVLADRLAVDLQRTVDIAGFVEVAGDRVAEVPVGLARERLQLPEVLVEPALPAADLEQLLGVEEERLAPLSGPAPELDGLGREIVGVVERAAEHGLRGLHQPRPPQQPRLAQAVGDACRDLDHVVRRIRVTGFERGAAAVERGVEADDLVLHLFGEAEELVAVRGALTQRVGREDRHVAQAQHARERTAGRPRGGPSRARRR